MLSADCLRELRSSWLPNLSDQGLDRLIRLLEQNSPLLVHGCFTQAPAMGCLATHAAWNHPETEHLNVEAGITWLHAVAGLNPATSHVLRTWDGQARRDPTVRFALLTHFKEERARRVRCPSAHERRSLVEV